MTNLINLANTNDFRDDFNPIAKSVAMNILAMEKFDTTQILANPSPNPNSNSNLSNPTSIQTDVYTYLRDGKNERSKTQALSQREEIGVDMLQSTQLINRGQPVTSAQGMLFFDQDFPPFSSKFELNFTKPRPKPCFETEEPQSELQSEPKCDPEAEPKAEPEAEPQCFQPQPQSQSRKTSEMARKLPWSPPGKIPRPFRETSVAEGAAGDRIVSQDILRHHQKFQRQRIYSSLVREAIQLEQERDGANTAPLPQTPRVLPFVDIDSPDEFQ